MKGHQKISVSLPIPLIDDLQTVCSRLRVTRSALLTSLLQTAVHDLVRMSDVLDLPLDTDEKIRRFRGDSVGLVTSRMSEFQSSVASLDKSFDKLEGGQ